MNDPENCFGLRVDFLSRLCGGELIIAIIKIAIIFLSRLCGGEQVITDLEFAFTFLSRLCGGERMTLLAIVLT